MAKSGSPSFAVFLVDGYNVLAAAVQNFTFKVTSMMQECTGLGDTWAQQCPTGVSKAEITQAGAYFDDTTNGIHDAFKAAGITSRVICWAPNGNTIGKALVFLEGAYSLGYAVVGKVDALTNADATYVASGKMDRGVILQDLTAKTADWNTKTLGTVVDYTTDPSQRVIPITSATKANPCVVTTTVAHGLTTGQKVLIAGNSLAGPSINADSAVTVISTTTFSVAINTTASTGAGTGGTLVRSSTVNGGASVQAISAFSGFTGFIGKVRHSADDSTYADLVAHTNVTSGPTAERVAVAAGTTVNRYLCFDGDVTGSGSLTIIAGFSRA